jgi:hypothetical protein
MIKQEKSMREGGNVFIMNNQSKLNTSVQNHLYSGPYKKNPETFQFPIMDTRSSKPIGTTLQPIPEYPKPQPNSNSGLDLRPRPVPGSPTYHHSPKSPLNQLPNSSRGPQSLLAMTQYGPRAIGPEAFIPPLDKLPRYTKSKYNPFKGTNLYMTDNRRSYIDAEQYPQLVKTPVVYSPGSPGNHSPTVIEPVKIPVGRVETVSPVNFFHGQRESTPFTYSPSNNSKMRASASKSQERYNPLDQFNTDLKQGGNSTHRKPVNGMYSPDAGKSDPWNRNAAVRACLVDT